MQSLDKRCGFWTINIRVNFAMFDAFILSEETARLLVVNSLHPSSAKPLQ